MRRSDENGRLFVEVTGLDAPVEAEEQVGAALVVAEGLHMRNTGVLS